jgi:hypothetical protein
MRAWLWGVVAVAIVVAAGSRSREQHSTSPVAERAQPVSSFVYDAAARFNERLVSTIDAIDTSLTAVMAGDVAVLVFAIDKIRELDPVGVWWAIAFLAASTMACAGGYVIGLPRTNQGDGLRPRDLIPDLLAKPHEAMTGAIADMVAAGEVNTALRLMKRVAVVIAMLLMFTGAILAALARFGGNVVR